MSEEIKSAETSSHEQRKHEAKFQGKKPKKTSASDVVSTEFLQIGYKVVRRDITRGGLKFQSYVGNAKKDPKLLQKSREAYEQLLRSRK